MLGDFGDGSRPLRRRRARKNYTGNSPITRASGKKRTVTARRARNNRLANPLHQQAFSALTCSPGARAYYDRIRARSAARTNDLAARRSSPTLKRPGSATT